MKSLATLANKNCYGELTLTLTSFSRFNNQPIYVACDEYVAQRIVHVPGLNEVNVAPIIGDKFLDTNQATGKNFMALMMLKQEIISRAVTATGSTLYVDADMLFFNPVTDIDLDNYEVCCSPHMIKEADENNFGRFNAGYVATNTQRFVDWWKEAAKTSTFYDQKCLERAPEHFKVKEIPITHNYGWWRINQSPTSADKAHRLSQFNVKGDQIRYGNNPLVSMHTHLLKGGHNKVTNDLARRLLSQSDNIKHRAILMSWDNLLRQR